MAKRIIRLANDVAATLNRDARTRDRIRLLFLPNYSVSLAELVDPRRRPVRAGVDRRDRGVGDGEHEALAQRRADDRHARRGEHRDPRRGRQGPRLLLLRHDRRGGRGEDAAPATIRTRPTARTPRSATAIDAIARAPTRTATGAATVPWSTTCCYRDPFLVLADYPAYAAAQREVEAAFLDPEHWARMALANVAGMGRFSSDETIRGYARDIWRVPLPAKAR